jgi:hypothetical protein
MGIDVEGLVQQGTRLAMLRLAGVWVATAIVAGGVPGAVAVGAREIVQRGGDGTPGMTPTDTLSPGQQRGGTPAPTPSPDPTPGPSPGPTPTPSPTPAATTTPAPTSSTAHTSTSTPSTEPPKPGPSTNGTEPTRSRSRERATVPPGTGP